MANTLVTAPTVPVVSSADAKLFLRVDAATEDDLIAAIVSVATEYGQQYLDQQFITATRREELESFPSGGVIILPYAPLLTVTSITYYDIGNTLRTWSTDEYSVDIVSKPGRVLLNHGYTWPSTYTRPDAVKILYTCGYGDAAANVPTNIVHAVKMLIHEYYTHREAKGNGTTAADTLFNLSSHGYFR